ncbi:MAG: B12-binding domain-containing radical SAM protein [Hyphomicrobiales bacterium]|nr:B12-binding domain-containing radical SAM protein [Hyphomicrobiales bacterium]MBV9432682.1 B12-binding domain-containing radical SAM protein [Hyphomicrobiales bacterium]
MESGRTGGIMTTFHIEIIKPSHYDRDGYVIQWWKAWIPSNSMASLYAIAQDCSARQVLGKDVAIEVAAFDEMNIKIPVDRIARRITQMGHGGLVCLVGVQTNQFPRAMAIARKLRAKGVPVAIGGFHVSGCMSMLKELTPELREALDLGIILFAGEAEEHFEAFIKDVYQGAPKAVYNYMHDLPNLQGHIIPYLPRDLVQRYDGILSSFDAGRGCPFQCSFCTIINVQGRKSRWRDADDIERIVRTNAAQGISRFFVTDDNFARNRNWEAIFDRMIELREVHGFKLHFLIQVDALAHKIPNFIEKAARAGCKYAFIGLESINPDNLVQMKKNQNRITEYRKMFQAWKEAGVVTYAGFIMGLPGDTPQSIRRDIEIIQRELPVDVLEFTMLTPLPGSEDHQKLHEKGVWMDADLNKYDLETVTIEHPRMSREEWQRTYQEMWNWYYTDEHVERLMLRNMAYGIKPVRILRSVLQVYGAANFEAVHPQQCGYFRRKDRTQRRPELPRVPAAIFYPRHVWQTFAKYARYGRYVLKMLRMRRRIERDPASKSYVDLAITPVVDAEGEALEMFELNASSRAAVEKARQQAERRRTPGGARPAMSRSA